ncbi:unnamed protein product [Protopolystoma xenopodis]|uniref:Uncharacterized protein n=1 Tax=Protopolystoma xenopodis TaxID=117903 RepID=A0A448XN81_9PLAT|nr:unnamed protein product [Protopolystoma xenopodis]
MFVTSMRLKRRYKVGQSGPQSSVSGRTTPPFILLESKDVQIQQSLLHHFVRQSVSTSIPFRVRPLLAIKADQHKHNETSTQSRKVSTELSKG